MRKCLKSRKHTFKNLHNLVQSLTDKPINDKLLVFSDKIVFVWILSQKPCVCQKPGVALGLANARPPGLTMRANAPQLPGGGGMGAAGIDWCISIEQTGFERKHSHNLSFLIPVEYITGTL